MALKQRILKASEFDLDDRAGFYEEGVRFENERLRPLIEALAQAVEALEDVQPNLNRIQNEINLCKQQYKMSSYPSIGWKHLELVKNAIANLERVVGGEK